MSDPTPWEPPDIDEEAAPLPLPQPEHQDQAVEDSHLFGAALFGTAPAGSIVPVPVVAMSGVDIASGPLGGPVVAPMVVDGFTITWGRTEALDQPEPAVCTLALFDPTRVWALGRDLIGQLVTVAWTAVKPGAGPVRTVMFIGRVTRARVQPQTAAGVDGTLVELTCASLLNDLANITPVEAWPDETMEARRARIATYTGNVATGGVTIRSFWGTPHVAPVAATEQDDILTHLMGLYSSSGADRMTFLPNTQAVRFVERRETSGRALAQLFWNVAGEGTARDGKGAYIRTRTTIPPTQTPPTLPLNSHYIDGGQVSYPDNSLTRDITARITRVEVEHPDSGATPAYTKRVETAIVATAYPTVTGRDEVTTGVRTARLSSSVAWNSYATTASTDLAGLAAREGGGWATEPLTWRTDGFDYWDQAADLLLVGAELRNWVFIERSWFPMYGVRPIFGIVGGTIGYSRKKWDLEFRLLPVSSADFLQHQLAWDEIDDGSSTYELQWWDDDHPRGLHESVTYEDMGYVGIGLGVATTPPANGWDEVYKP